MRDSDGHQYVKQVLDGYRSTPGTTGRLHPSDRLLARQLHQREVPLSVVQAAFLLAAARRGFREPQLPSLGTIRSLHYFLPVVEELLQNPLPAGYVEYLRGKLQKLRPTQHQSAPPAPAPNRRR